MDEFYLIDFDYFLLKSSIFVPFFSSVIIIILKRKKINLKKEKIELNKKHTKEMSNLKKIEDIKEKIQIKESEKNSLFLVKSFFKLEGSNLDYLNHSVASLCIQQQKLPMDNIVNDILNTRKCISNIWSKSEWYTFLTNLDENINSIHQSINHINNALLNYHSSPQKTEDYCSCYKIIEKCKIDIENKCLRIKYILDWFEVSFDEEILKLKAKKEMLEKEVHIIEY